MKVPVQTRAFAIYVFGPSPEGKFYVGQTENVTRRFGSHLKAQGKCPEFHKAVRLYGLESFPVQIVVETDVAEEAGPNELLHLSGIHTIYAGLPALVAPHFQFRISGKSSPCSSM